MKRFLVAGATFVLLAAPSFHANAADSVAFFLDDRHIVTPVDWQTWCGDCVGVDYTTGSPYTINPGWVSGYTPPVMADLSLAQPEHTDGCLWDKDDEVNYKTNPFVTTLAAGASLIATECRWISQNRFDAGGPNAYIRFSSASSDLIVSIKWDWGANSLTYVVGPVQNGQTWNYYACLTAPGAAAGTDIPVTGSHDGHGIYELVTVTVTNPGRKAGKTGGIFGLGWFVTPSSWCSSFLQL